MKHHFPKRRIIRERPSELKRIAEMNGAAAESLLKAIPPGECPECGGGKIEENAYCNACTLDHERMAGR